ncbi:MAG: pentapeptide repeat-containing protein [Cyanobacteria bacterium J06598_3]
MNYLALLESGIDNWNRWRSQNPDAVCDLSGQDLSEGYFVQGNFQNVNFTATQLRCACLIEANLQGAILIDADLSGAYMGEANLQGADLTGTNLTETNLNRADLRAAKLAGTDISVANTYKAQFSEQPDAPPNTPPNTPPANREHTDRKAPVRVSQQLEQHGTEQHGNVGQAPSLPSEVSGHAIRVKHRPKAKEVTHDTAQSSQAKTLAQPVDKPPASPQPTADKPIADKPTSPDYLGSDRKVPLLKKPIALWFLAMMAAASLLGLSFLVLGITPHRDKSPSLPITGQVEPPLKPLQAGPLNLTQSIESDTQVWAIATATDKAGQPIIIGGSDGGDITVWDQNTGRTVGTITGHQDTIRALAASDSGRWIISGSGDGIKVWDTEAGELAYSIGATDATIWAVAISPSERIFVSADYDGTITVWHLETGEAIYSVEQGTPVWDLAIAPDGQSFVSSGSDRTIIQWDLVSGDQLQTFSAAGSDGHQDGVRSLAISPDGTTLASGSWDSTIKLWSLETGELQTTLTGHTGRVVSIAISPDGNTLASGGTDNQLKYWNLADGELIETVYSSTNWILAVAFSSANNNETQASSQARQLTTLISSGKDQTVKVWQPQTQAQQN